MYSLAAKGPLCGKCVDGHSEAFGTEECVPNSQCTASRWLAPAIFAVGLLYVALVAGLPVDRHPLWKSIAYFMQAVPLLSSAARMPC